MLATNDSLALKRSKFNKDIAAFCKCVGTYYGGDFVPAQFSVLAADHVANSLMRMLEMLLIAKA